MFTFWKRQQPEAPRPQLADGQRVYAIGDVHGCQSLLEALMWQIMDDIEARPAAEVRFVLLGDLINRGPDSASVLQMLLDWPQASKPPIVLRGNHEQVLVSAWHGDLSACRIAHRMGVRATLASYGVDVSSYEAWEIETLADAIRTAIPASHIEYLAQTPLSWRCGDYVFAHASFRPGTPAEQQDEGDLLWSRVPYQPMADDMTSLVHGHANLQAVANEPQRICVDTSAHSTGVLTAVALEKADRWFLATGTANADA